MTKEIKLIFVLVFIQVLILLFIYSPIQDEYMSIPLAWLMDAYMVIIPFVIAILGITSLKKERERGIRPLIYLVIAFAVSIILSFPYLTYFFSGIV